MGILSGILVDATSVLGDAGDGTGVRILVLGVQVDSVEICVGIGNFLTNIETSNMEGNLLENLKII